MVIELSIKGMKMKKIRFVAITTIALMFAGCGSSDSKSSNALSEKDGSNAMASNIRNNKDTFAPKIKSFRMVGNTALKNGVVVVSKSKKGGKFSYKIVLEDTIHANTVRTRLTDASQEIIKSHDLSLGDTIEYDCTLDKVAESNEGVDYTCSDIVIDNTSGKSKTFLEVIVCNDTEDKCSAAGIEVLFTE